MVIYHFDSTIDGIFACIYQAYIQKQNPLYICDGDVQTSLDNEIIFVQSDSEKTKRIATALIKYGCKNALFDIKYAFRSSDPNKNMIIFNYIKAILDERKNISGKFSCPAVLKFFDLVRKISYEIHRMKGFMRFNKAENGVYYASFNPDNDITDLLLPHFKARYKNMQFALHDVKRNILAMYNGEQSKIVHCENVISVTLMENDSYFVNLWRAYYNSVNIKQRKNTKQMNGYMPVRYRPYLTECNYQHA